MNEITVNASAAYKVLIQRGLLNSISLHIQEVTNASAVVIVTDDHVWPLFGKKLVSQLQDSGQFNVHSFVFPSGEQHKNAETYLSLLEFLVQNHISRSDCMIALGGGVVGDLTGFTAATYLRGIDYIQVPTTLLAAVDSSVGGKTAIDLKAGKNLVGAFYHPKLVICDIDTFSTLPESVFRDGCAEIIKYAVLYDPELFSHLMKHGMGFDREWVVRRCIELKRDVVSRDEFDRGDRQKLNLGHTFGHGIERLSNYTIPHGQAVSIGMSLIARSAEKHQICSPATADQILSLLHLFNLPTQTQYTAHDIYESALSDKKRTAKIVPLIFPEIIGRCIVRPTNISELEEYIQAGL